MFGICFGNQMLGRALGFGTYKLRFGHRGVNQPVQDRVTGQVAITSHNHGFAVDAPLDGPTDTAFGGSRSSHVDLNDDVVEGLRCLDVAGVLACSTTRRRPPARTTRPTCSTVSPT